MNFLIYCSLFQLVFTSAAIAQVQSADKATASAIDLHLEAVEKNRKIPSALKIRSEENPAMIQATIPALKTLLAHNRQATGDNCVTTRGPGQHGRNVDSIFIYALVNNSGKISPIPVTI